MCVFCTLPKVRWKQRKGAPHQGGAHNRLLNEFPNFTWSGDAFPKRGTNPKVDLIKEVGKWVSKG